MIDGPSGVIPDHPVYYRKMFDHLLSFILQGNGGKIMTRRSFENSSQDRVYIVAKGSKPLGFISPREVLQADIRTTERATGQKLYIFDGKSFYSPITTRKVKVSSDIFFYAMGLHYRVFTLKRSLPYCCWKKGGK